MSSVEVALPAQYRIDSESRIIFSTARGVLTEEDLRGHQSRLLADPAFDPKFDQLWDFSEVTKLHVERKAVSHLAQARSFEAGVKRAVVAPSDLAFGMARMFQLLHDQAPEEVRVFRSQEEAQGWLGIDG